MSKQAEAWRDYSGFLTTRAARNQAPEELQPDDGLRMIGKIGKS